MMSEMDRWFSLLFSATWDIDRRCHDTCNLRNLDTSVTVWSLSRVVTTRVASDIDLVFVVVAIVVHCAQPLAQSVHFHRCFQYLLSAWFLRQNTLCFSLQMIKKRKLRLIIQNDNIKKVSPRCSLSGFSHRYPVICFWHCPFVCLGSFRVSKHWAMSNVGSVSVQMPEVNIQEDPTDVIYKVPPKKIGRYSKPKVYERLSHNEYQCIRCHKVMPRMRAVVKHFDLVHGPKEQQCDICNKYFRDRKHLNRHKHKVGRDTTWESEFMCFSTERNQVWFHCRV